MEKNTKERILDAAFSFYRGSMFENVSLSQIAQRAGISKAAIFKHFKNKDALLRAMDDRMYADITPVIGRVMAHGRHGEVLPPVIDFLLSHREYVFYLICSKPSLTTDAVVRELHQRAILPLGLIYGDDGAVKDLRLYFVNVFTSTTVLIFILWLFKVRDGGEVLGYDAADFARRLDVLIEGGVGGGPMAEGRLAELDGLCAESVAGLEEADRSFLALSSVIAAVGLQNVTIEKIADELGLAKSSLYSLYANKMDLIESSIRGELKKLYEAIIASLRGARTPAERLYVLFQTEAAYFVARPEVISIFQALFANAGVYSGTGREDEGYREFCAQMRRMQLFERLPDVGLPMVDDTPVFAWLFVLPSIVYIHCRSNGFSDALTRTVVRKVYYMVEFGINYEEMQ